MRDKGPRALAITALGSGLVYTNSRQRICPNVADQFLKSTFAHALFIPVVSWKFVHPKRLLFSYLLYPFSSGADDNAARKL